MMDPKIILMVALPAEASPLIAALGLRRLRDRPFKIYGTDDFLLIVSGVGKTRSAAATGFLQGALPERHRGWLQVGVAGHETHELGSCFLAHKIIDLGSGRSFYPTIVFKAPCPKEIIATVDAVVLDYPERWLYEMEASGFYSAAHQGETSELIQVMKVISDNKDAPVGTETLSRIEPAIAHALPMVLEVIGFLTVIVDELRVLVKPSPMEEWFLKKWSFSTTGTRRLEKLLRRFHLLSPCGLDRRSFEACRNFKDALRVLDEIVKRLPIKVH